MLSSVLWMHDSEVWHEKTPVSVALPPLWDSADVAVDGHSWCRQVSPSFLVIKAAEGKKEAHCRAHVTFKELLCIFCILFSSSSAP